MSVQKVFIHESNVNLGANLGNVLQAHKELTAANGNAEKVLTVLGRFGMASAQAHIQSLSKAASAAFLFYATNGKQGYNVLHLTNDKLLTDYIRSKDADKAIVKTICDEMAAHPDTGRAATWETIRSVFVQ